MVPVNTEKYKVAAEENHQPTVKGRPLVLYGSFSIISLPPSVVPMVTLPVPLAAVTTIWLTSLPAGTAISSVPPAVRLNVFSLDAGYER